MLKITSHRLVFKTNHSLKLGDAIPSGLRDDEGAHLPMGGRCMIDSILHRPEAGQYIVTVSHYLGEGPR